MFLIQTFVSNTGLEWSVADSVDVSMMLGNKWMGITAADKLTGRKSKESELLDQVCQRIRFLDLRLRYDTKGTGGSEGPYLVKSPVPLTALGVDNMLRAMTPRRRKQFLKGAKL